MRRIAACVLAGGLACCALDASADVIATVPVTFNNLYPSAIVQGSWPDDMVISIGGRPIPPPPRPPFPYPLPNELLEQYRVAVADVGKTFTVTAENDPQFPGFVDLLTGGGGEFVLSTYISVESPEGNVIGSSRGGKGFSLGPTSTFANYQVTRISYHLDSLTITDNVTPDPTFPQYHGREFAGQVTFTLEGTPVPEPTTASLLALALTSLTLRRRHRRHRRQPA